MLVDSKIISSFCQVLQLVEPEKLHTVKLLISGMLMVVILVLYFYVGDESILAQVLPKLVDLQRQGMMLNTELSSEKEVLQQSMKAILDLRNDVTLKCAEVSFKCCSEVAVKCADVKNEVGENFWNLAN